MERMIALLEGKSACQTIISKKAYFCVILRDYLPTLSREFYFKSDVKKKP